MCGTITPGRAIARTTAHTPGKFIVEALGEGVEMHKSARTPRKFGLILSCALYSVDDEGAGRHFFAALAECYGQQTLEAQAS